MDDRQLPDEIIVVSYLGEGMFKSEFVTKEKGILIGLGDKSYVVGKISEFTRKRIKTYVFYFCAEWDEY